MNTEKVKKFVKEHKKEIIIGVVCAGIGVHYGKKHYGVSKDEMKLVKDLREFKDTNLFKDIYEVSEKANTITPFIPACEQRISNITDAVKMYQERTGANPETTGFVVFTK